MNSDEIDQLIPGGPLSLNLPDGDPPDDDQMEDICRVCRMEGSPGRQLFHPCLCTGSIKFIHQECLTQWLKYSKKEYCELCNHKYTFQPIYHPDMPKRLPVRDLVGGLAGSLMSGVKAWLHYTLVAVAWFGIVPLSACRIYRCLLTGSVSSLLTLPLDIVSTKNILGDCMQGALVIGVTLSGFISLIWLREQIVHGGWPAWMDVEEEEATLQPEENNAAAAENPPEAAPPPQAAAPSSGPDEDGHADSSMHQPGEPEPSHARSPDDEVPSTSGLERVEFVSEEDAHLDSSSSSESSDDDEEGVEGVDDLNHGEEQPDVEGNAAGNENAAQDGGNAENDENWQPFELNQAVEEWTWERVLGLDGSLVFLEHVFWVIAVTTLFVLVFVFSPFHIGYFAVVGFRLMDVVKASLFEGVVTTLIGYVVAGVTLFLLCYLLRGSRLKRMYRVIGMCYLVVKVFLLIVLDIGIFPLLCGWWLDICSLNLFASTVQQRVDSFKSSPGTSMFVHWLVGMVYVFYFASFILLMREVLRPGVLWFLRNLNDPDFNPVLEMLQLPVHKHVRRFLSSGVLFGGIILLLVYIPVTAIRTLCPRLLPYRIALNIDTPFSELSLELLLLQVVLPALLEQSQARQALKQMAKEWCRLIGRLLGLQEYLLPTSDLDPQSAPAPPTTGSNEASADSGQNNTTTTTEEESHHVPNVTEAVAEPSPSAAYGPMSTPSTSSTLDGDYWNNANSNNTKKPATSTAETQTDDNVNPVNPAPAQPGKDHVAPPPEVEEDPGVALPQQPLPNVGAEHQAMIFENWPTGNQPYKRPDHFALRICVLLSVIALSLLLCSFVCLTVPVTLGRTAIKLVTGRANSHELYTLATGLYISWLVMRGGVLAAEWLTNRYPLRQSVFYWARVVSKATAAAAGLLILLPLLMGTVFQVVVVTPMRVNVGQTPIAFPVQDWAMGILHCKIGCALIMMAGDLHLKAVFERIYQDGLRNLDLGYVYAELVLPVGATLGAILALPYVVAHGLLPVYGYDRETEVLFQRHVYPCLLLVTAFVSFLVWNAKQLNRLLLHIRNERYLVGQRLVNFDRERAAAAAAAAALAAPALD